MFCEFPNTVTVGGYLRSPRLLPRRGHSGQEIHAELRNPSKQREDLAVTVELKGFGKKGAALLDLDGALVIVSGRFGFNGDGADGAYLVVDQVFVMDESDDD